ncbi:hypothetical protein vseg_018096 [Gypsophila vaccaria]
MKSLILVVVVTLVVLQSTVRATNRYKLDLHPTLTKEVYSQFLTDIRTNVMDPELKYGGTDLPVIRAPTTIPTFLRIDLIAPKGTISIALRRSDLYFVAYLAQNERDNFRAYYFRDLIKNPQLDDIFPEAKAKGYKNHEKIKYDERYEPIEHKAKKTRKEAGLGIDTLILYMDDVIEMPHKEVHEARFIMLAIEMVCEAARFNYIEEQILEHFPKEFGIYDDHIIVLENNWFKISKRINGSTKGVFTPPYTLKGSHWTVHNAAELKMGLLGHVTKDGLSHMIKINPVNVIVFLASLIFLCYIGAKLVRSYMVKKAVKSR